MPPKYLDPRELAEALDTSYDLILQWTRLGVIPVIKAGGRNYYRLDKVMKAIRKRQRAEASELEPASA